MKSCKKGYYYCNTEKKCMPIPDGHTVRDDGFLMKEAKDGDHEPEMIRNQLKTAGRASKRIEKHSRNKKNFKAWVQSKITKASDYLDTAADYLDSKEVKEASNPAQQAAIAIDMKKKGKKPKNMSEEGLRAWFGKSSGTTKSGRKVKGWVQVGGKYDGKPCARQPGQKTTPKCTSSSKRASMSDKERDSARRRKVAKDPNQPQKSGAAAPTMVSTDPKKKMKEEFTTLPLQLEIPKTKSDFTKGLMFRESLEANSGMLFVFDRIAQQSFHMTETTIPLDIAFIKENGIIESIKPLEPKDSNPVYSEGAIELAIEVNRGWFAENNIEVGDELVVEYIVEDPKEKYRSETGTIFDIINEVKDKKGKGSGKKDACYHKVKSRYSVWPSAYASGALVKCRKVGAANWGNKSEGLEIENSKGQVIADVVDIIGPDNLQPITNDNGVWKGTQQVAEKHYGSSVNKIPAELDKAVTMHKSQAKRLRDSEEVKKDAGKAANDVPAQLDKAVALHTKQAKTLRKAGISEENLDEKCWKGYKKKGMKTMFGKRYPNCVKKKVGESVYDWRKEVLSDIENIEEAKIEKKEEVVVKTKDVTEQKSNWKDEIGYEGKDDSKKSIDEAKSAAWQRKEGKSESGGLNAKGVASYRAANPGSKLKTAVTTKPSKLKKGSKASKRRKSFCARMKGMKKRLTSAKTARDPDSRINKSLRKWNC